MGGCFKRGDAPVHLGEGLGIGGCVIHCMDEKGARCRADRHRAWREGDGIGKNHPAHIAGLACRHPDETLRDIHPPREDHPGDRDIGAQGLPAEPDPVGEKPGLELEWNRVLVDEAHPRPDQDREHAGQHPEGEKKGCEVP